MNEQVQPFCNLAVEHGLLTREQCESVIRAFEDRGETPSLRAFVQAVSSAFPDVEADKLLQIRDQVASVMQGGGEAGRADPGSSEPERVVAEGGRLFSEGQVMLSTFLGTLIAGGLLMRANYRTLGQEGKGRNALLLGVVGTVVISVACSFVGEILPDFAVAIIHIAIVGNWYKKAQGHEFRRHAESGGETESSWKAAGIGLVIGVLVFCVFLSLVVL